MEESYVDYFANRTYTVGQKFEPLIENIYYMKYEINALYLHYNLT